VELLDLGMVTRVMIARYACAVGDFNPVHLDDDFARRAGLPSVIAHGPLTGALLLHAAFRAAGAPRSGRLDLRLREPVFPGDHLTAAVAGDGAIQITDAAGRVKATAQLKREP